MNNNTECNAVFDLIKEIHTKERELRRKHETWLLKPSTRFAITLIIVVAFVALVVLAFVSQQGFHSGIAIIKPAVITCLLLIYGCVLYFPLAELWLRRGAVMDAIEKPERVILFNPILTAQADLAVTDKLMAIKLQTLEMAAMQLQHEIGAFHRRMGVVIGTLEKIGIFPALLALYVIVYKLGGFEVGWSSIITSTLPILYLVGMFAHYQLLRLERNHRLIELVINRKQEIASKPKAWKRHIKD